jgi:hypothetical protein
MTTIDAGVLNHTSGESRGPDELLPAHAIDSSVVQHRQR